MSRKNIYGAGVSSAASKGIDLEDAGSAEIIEIEQIQVDADYQRELRYDLVNKISKEYDIVKAGPILVNERKSGGLWCVDGQHRMVGAAQAGETEIFAHVTHGLTKAEEAELRLARNDRRSDNVFEKFRSRLVMGDQKAEAMVELVRQHGTQLNTSVNVHSGINALVAAETLYDAGAGNGLWLGRVLEFIRDTFGEESDEEFMGGSVVSASMMKATAWFLDRHVPAVSRTELSERIRLSGIDEIDRQARNYRAISGGAQWLNYYRALVGVWNFGRQDKNKIEPKTIGSISELGTAAAPRGQSGAPSTWR